ncbi:MAG TPA: hypothetical protein EYH06_05000 [Chromatiales bacterium]|nr:hypothetical protein [Thiotrichales bacterium]HIP67934.1 hypothetical protein [Chromatiales bacterium]
MRQLRFQPLWLAIGISLLLFVAYMSLIPPRVGIGEIEYSDLFLHLLAYATITGWFQQIYGRKGLIYVAVAMLFYGGMLELAQHYFPPREPHWSDFFANASGVVLATLISTTRIRDTLFIIEKNILSVAHDS